MPNKEKGEIITDIWCFPDALREIASLLNKFPGVVTFLAADDQEKALYGVTYFSMYFTLESSTGSFRVLSQLAHVSREMAHSQAGDIEIKIIRQRTPSTEVGLCFALTGTANLKALAQHLKMGLIIAQVGVTDPIV
jgi:hypothetical protein